MAILLQFLLQIGIMASQSCATANEALAAICEKAMGRWSAAECLAELERFMASERVVRLGLTEQLTDVFTSKATLDLEASISQRVADGSNDRAHRIAESKINGHFDRLEMELAAKLGTKVSLAQQRAAALHIAAQTGRHAFVEGWAGTGKTTMLKAVGEAYASAGFSVFGCCQSAAASQNLARETGIPSRTIASLLLSLREGKAKLTAKTVLVLDEAGMVGSKEFDLVQQQVIKAGAKLVAVGDPKQLQPIDAGGIFGSLMRKHGNAEISNIQRQRTDFDPLLKWLEGRASKANGGLTVSQAKALRSVPEDARMRAIEDVCSQDAKLSRALGRWRARFDYQWMREAVELFAKGEALPALQMLDAKDRLKVCAGSAQAMDLLIEAWHSDKTKIANKTMIAATRAEVAELNRRSRERRIAEGAVDDSLGVDIEIIHRDDTVSQRRFAPGDRIVFTMNDRALGVANGVAGTIRAIEGSSFMPTLVVDLDDKNERNEACARVPASFGRFDHAYCLTNHKSQGRTFDSAYVLANPSMADREWTYVAASRSRFATTLFVNAAALGLVDPEAHQRGGAPQFSRSDAIEALAGRMRRSRAKGTTLDYADAEASSNVESMPPVSLQNLDSQRAHFNVSPLARAAIADSPALAAAGDSPPPLAAVGDSSLFRFGREAAAKLIQRIRSRAAFAESPASNARTIA